MEEYHKINTIYKRDMANKKRLIEGDWSTPEFEYLQHNKWEFTEKVDGTNIRVKITRVANSCWVEYGGRTDAANIPPHLTEHLEETFPTYGPYRRDLMRPAFGKRHMDLLDWMLTKNLTDVVLYGEGFGPKIQQGEKYGDAVKFVLFDVKVGDWWLDRAGVEDVAKALDIPVVPVLGYGTLHDAVHWVKGDMGSKYGYFEAEGIVARPTVPMYTRKGERIIAKIKCRDFK